MFTDLGFMKVDEVTENLQANQYRDEKLQQNTNLELQLLRTATQFQL